MKEDDAKYLFLNYLRNEDEAKYLFLNYLRNEDEAKYSILNCRWFAIASIQYSSTFSLKQKLRPLALQNMALRDPIPKQGTKHVTD